MTGENDGGGYKKNNVIPINDTGRSRREDNSMEDLLGHMRTLRDSVPVNHRLRQELKVRLLDGQITVADKPDYNPVNKMRLGKSKNLGWAAGVFLFVSLVTVALLILNVSGPKSLEMVNMAELGRFWTEDTPLAPSISPSNGFIVVERGGALLLLGRHGSQFAVVSPPPGVKYSSPCWSPDGSKLAMVRQKEAGSEIITLTIPSGTVQPDSIQRAVERGLEQAGVTAVRAGGSPPAGLSWSPDGNSLAYSLLEGDQSRVYLTGGGQTLNLSPGKNPAWSPDGKWLVVEREGLEKTLWLLNKKSGKAFALGPGKSPVWNNNGHLIYVKINIREKILSYLPDGSPQFTVQRKTGEIRWIFLGKGSEIENNIILQDGLLSRAKLLSTADGPTGPEELQWLKNLELGGVRSPRTLFLDRAEEYEGLASGEGGSLLLSRRYGDTVALIRIDLRENTLKREGGSI